VEGRRVNVAILGTGSKGNAIVVECEGERVLIDAGYPARTLVRRLKAADIAPESIGALVLTHEHSDHTCGARTAARRFGWTVYATAGTIAATPRLREVNPVAISPRESLRLESMRVTSVRTPHDGDDPVALVIDAVASGARCAFVYDLGHVTQTIEQAVRDVDALVLESNHDDAMLRSGPYPPSLKRRVAGPKGHLSNAEAGALARRVAHAGLRHLILAHLSEQNNTPDVARLTVARALRGTGYRGTLSVSRQHGLTRFRVERSRAVEQMALGL
jgi:phosphoribosyl 1,2-cyclic phosphodiesterase